MVRREPFLHCYTFEGMNEKEFNEAEAKKILVFKFQQINWY